MGENGWSDGSLKYTQGVLQAGLRIQRQSGPGIFAGSGFGFFSAKMQVRIQVLYIEEGKVSFARLLAKFNILFGKYRLAPVP